MNVLKKIILPLFMGGGALCAAQVTPSADNQYALMREDNQQEEGSQDFPSEDEPVFNRLHETEEREALARLEEERTWRGFRGLAIGGFSGGFSGGVSGVAVVKLATSIPLGSVLGYIIATSIMTLGCLGGAGMGYCCARRNFPRG